MFQNVCMPKHISLSVGHGLCQLLVLYSLPSSTTVVSNLVWVTDLFWEYEESSRHSPPPQNGIHVPSSQPRDRLKPLLLWVFGRNVSKNGLGFCQLGIYVNRLILVCYLVYVCLHITIYFLLVIRQNLKELRHMT